jgi:itaconate CoA-transferase
MLRPLDGITVVSFEQAIAAPFASRHLAEAGARVIKVERPGEGDFARAYDTRVNGLCSHFVWVNRSKESLTLDIKHAGAAPILNRLLARADVLIQNLAPGAAARSGLGADRLRAKHPRLIVCNISGYGEDGPYRDKKAYDLLIQAEAGVLSVSGTEATPAKAGIPVADIAAGSYAYSSILNALLLRARSGVGATIDVSMLESLAEWMGFPIYYTYDGAKPPPRAGASHATIYPYGPFQAGDGGTVVLGLQNEREWAIFCNEVLAQPGLVEDARFGGALARSDRRAELKAIIEASFASLTADEVVARLDRAKIGCARMNAPTDLWAHPQLEARGHWVDVSSPVGPIRNLRPPARTDAYEPNLGAIPAIGEHTDAILAELGFNRAEIEAMRSAATV